MNDRGFARDGRRAHSVHARSTRQRLGTVAACSGLLIGAGQRTAGVGQIRSRVENAAGDTVAVPPGLVTTGQSVLRTGQVVAATGHWVTVAGHWVSAAGHCVAVAGHRVAFAGQLVRSGGHRVSTTGQ
jgi:uncharacterized Zn-binding protein involved in type VI secretion